MRIAASVLLALVPAVVAAQQPTRSPVRLTLQDAIERALRSGNEVRIAEAGVHQAEGQVTEAWSSALPEIRASVTYQRTFASVFDMSTGPALAPYSPDTTASLAARIRYLEQEYPNAVIRGLGGLFSDLPFGRPNTYIAALTFSQTLFQGGKVGAGIAGAHAYEQAARAQLDETRRDVTYRVTQAYLNALYAERIVDITEASQVQVNDQLHRVSLNHQVGSSADYDLLRAQVEAANQEPLVIAARNSRDIALLEVRRLVNMPADQPVELASGLLVTPAEALPRVDSVALNLDAAGRAAIEAAQATVEFRRQAVRVYHGDYYPSLKLTSSFGGQAFPVGTFPSGIGDFRRDWSASLVFSMPLFNGFKTHGVVTQAEAELSRAQAQLSQTRESVAIEIEQARAEIARAQALVAARHVTVGQAERAQHLASVRYANGIATALEVSDARLALEQASVNEAQATHDYLLAIAALERALGHPVPLQKAGSRVAEGQ